LLIIPFLVRLLSVEEFAHYDLFLMSAAIVQPIVLLGVDSGMAIMIADHKENKRLINWLFTFSFFSSIIAILIIWFFSYLIIPNFKYMESILRYAHFLFIYLIFNLISAQVFNFLRWMGRAGIASL